jgi:hypothetical protein
MSGRQAATVDACCGGLLARAGAFSRTPPTRELARGRVSSAAPNLATTTPSLFLRQKKNAQGFNWAGFNYGMGFVEGVGEPGAPALASDFATAVYRQALLGFNLVRLPFRFAGLDAPPPTRLAFSCKPATVSQVRRVLSSNPFPPFDDIDTAAMPLPRPRAPPARPRKGDPACNWYIPDTSVLDRLLFAAQYYVANGFYVILDWHPTDHPEAFAREDSALVSDEAGFARAWGRLAAAVASLPAWKEGHLPGRVFFDLMNEPDRLGLAWNVPTTGKVNETALAAAVRAGEVGGGKGGRASGTVRADTAAAAPPSTTGRRLAQWAPVEDGLQTGLDPRAAMMDGGGSGVVVIGPDGRAEEEEEEEGGEEGATTAGVAAAIAAGTYNITQRPLVDLYLAAADAVLAATPTAGKRGSQGSARPSSGPSGALFILEGTNQSYWTPPMAWGTGFMTDPAVAADHKAQGRLYSDAAPFFDALTAKPAFAARVALGPHVYGPSLGWDPSQNSGQTLWATHSKAIGYGSKFGATFPVILTEFGSHLDTAADVAWLADLARWANCGPPPAPSCGPGGDHSPIAAWAWWQWSPTAWDTGGLVEDDWVTPAWAKINNLTSVQATAGQNGGGWWLRPWYLGPKQPSGGAKTGANGTAGGGASAGAPAPGPAPV